jgi:hypothetical protein
MLKCKDFHAEQTSCFGVVSVPYEPIENVLGRVNEWISSEKIRVLNAETITAFCAWDSRSGRYHVRVWYEE